MRLCASVQGSGARPPYEGGTQVKPKIYTDRLKFGFITISALAADAAPKISKEQLKEMLDNSDVIILDVRTSEDWQKSEFKIKGAIRKRPKFFDSWANEFPRGKALVFY